jgi:hypothetical protein
MIDISKTTAPKTDQLNYDDIPNRKAITIKVTKVSGCEDAAQPIAINFEGDNNKPYKPCKSMRRVMVHCWGSDGHQYVGRSMTLFGDPTVIFGGIAVGGIRISHLSDIDKEVTMALTASKASRKPYTVKPLAIKAQPSATPTSSITDEAKALAKEIGFADTLEKLKLLEPRCEDICRRLVEAKLPDWEKRIIEVIGEQMKKVDPSHIISAG